MASGSAQVDKLPQLQQPSVNPERRFCLQPSGDPFPPHIAPAISFDWPSTPLSQLRPRYPPFPTSIDTVPSRQSTGHVVNPAPSTTGTVLPTVPSIDWKEIFRVRIRAEMEIALRHGVTINELGESFTESLKEVFDTRRAKNEIGDKNEKEREGR